MLVLAWICAAVGAIVAYVVSLAGAMKTVPSLDWHDALVGVPLPALGVLLAAYCLARRPESPGDKPWLAAGIPLALSCLALLIVAVSYFDQPGGPR